MKEKELKAILTIVSLYGNAHKSGNDKVSALTGIRNTLEAFRHDRETCLTVSCQAIDAIKEQGHTVSKYIDPVSSKEVRNDILANIKRDLAKMVNSLFDFGNNKLVFVTHKSLPTSYKLKEETAQKSGVRRAYDALTGFLPHIDETALKGLIADAIDKAESERAQAAEREKERREAFEAHLKAERDERITKILNKTGRKDTPAERTRVEETLKAMGEI